MEIKIKIDAPGLTEAINNLAGALQGNNVVEIDSKEVTKNLSKKEKDTPKIEKETKKKEDPTPAPAKTEKEEPTITLETVRVKLADLAQAGKQAEAKELISSYGVKRLSDIPAENYAELLEKASEL